MKIKLISIVAVIAAGILVLMMTISNYASVEKDYNTAIAKARANAERMIPYNAYNNYKSAFEIRCDDEAIYKEYLAQAELLGEEFYKAAVKDYVVKFPHSMEGYELLCRMYYDSGNYKAVITTALEARDHGAATEQVRDWYNECSHMLRNVKSGLEEAQTFVGSYALVKVNGLYGYINTDGDFLLAPYYKQASPMMASGGAVNDGEEWHIINRLGYKIARTSEPVEYMGVMVGNKIPAMKNGKYAYLTTALQLPEEMPYDYASNFKNGIAAVKKGNSWALINSNEELVTEYIFEDVVLDEHDTCCNQNVIFVKKDGKYYMLNSEGTRITEQAFDNVKPFVSTQPAAVCIDGKWGYVNTSGQIVVEPQFDDADSFSIGLGAVCIDGLWGYMNSGLEMRVDCQFEACKPFTSMGIAAVKQDGLWKYVQLLGYQM